MGVPVPVPNETQGLRKKWYWYGDDWPDDVASQRIVKTDKRIKKVRWPATHARLKLYMSYEYFLLLLPSDYQTVESAEGNKDAILSYIEKVMRPYTMGNLEPEEILEEEQRGVIPPGSAHEYGIHHKVDYWRAGSGHRPYELKWNCPDPLPETAMRVADIPAGYLPAGVVTPDGVWHQGRTRWIFESRHDPEWHEEYKMLLRDYPNHIAVSMGGHV